MSDMLAVLLGAGGGKGAHAIALLSAGKAEAAQTQAAAAAGDLFMEALSARLNPAAIEGGIPAADGVDLLATQAGKEPADGASKPLEGGWSPAGAAPADPTLQAILVVAGGLPDALGIQPGTGTASPETSADGGMPEIGTAPVSMSAAAARSAAMPKHIPADSAAAWQGLPTMGEGDSPAGLSQRADPTQTVTPNVASSGSMVLGLAAQFREAVAEVTGKATDPAAGGVGQATAPASGFPIAPAGEAAVRPTPANMVHLGVEAPLRSPMFAQELGERIVWMSSRHGQMADIAINPPHLGPVEVKLSFAGGEAGAQFFSPHPQVREAIESALPRLREMLAEAGVTLGQAQVRDEAFPRQEAFVQDRPGQGGERGGQFSTGMAPAVDGPRRVGLVDLYV